MTDKRFEDANKVMEVSVDLYQYIGTRTDITEVAALTVLAGSFLSWVSIILAKLGRKYRRAADAFEPNVLAGVVVSAFKLGVIYGGGDKQAVEKVEEIVAKLE